jgi:hypothetical protein
VMRGHNFSSHPQMGFTPHNPRPSVSIMEISIQ